MVKKSQNSTGHDSAVRRVAGGFKSQGWKVSADHTDAYPTPRKIYGKRPDVIATKGKKMRIVEVETPESYGGSHYQAQKRAFSRFASLDKKRTFRTKKTK